MDNRFQAPVHPRQGAFQQAEDTVAWNVWAPHATSLQLKLWREGDAVLQPMTADDSGHHHCRAEGIAEGTRYAYVFPNGNVRPDPASRWQPDGVHQPSAVLFPNQFQWTDHAWRGISAAELVIYELHIGTFTPGGTFESAIDRLADLADLGITAIEIMPISQFPGTRNWGYDGVHPYAAQNSYGGPQGLHKLVDAAHQAGIAVLLDVVYNHFGPEGAYFSEYGPYFTDHHHTPWGSAINYDGAYSEAVRHYVVENACQWIRDFHIDGLRLDAVQTIYDLGATHILADIQKEVQQVAKQQNRTVHVIAETNQNDRRLLETTERGGYNLDGVWADDFHHAVHTVLTGETEGYYLDFGDTAHLAKSFETPFVYDGSYSPFRKRRHGNSATGLPREQFVVAVQNHDQVGNRMRGERFGELLKPPQQRLAGALLLVCPYTPMLFMGEEYGETSPFPFFCSFTDEHLIESVRRGRREEFAACEFRWEGEPPDPHAVETFDSARLEWSWPAGSAAALLRQMYRDLLRFRREWTALHSHSIPRVSLQGETTDLGLPLLRLEYEELTILANLSGKKAEFLDGKLGSARFSSEDRRYGGCRDDATADNLLLAHELRVYSAGAAE